MILTGIDRSAPTATVAPNRRSAGYWWTFSQQWRISRRKTGCRVSADAEARSLKSTNPEAQSLKPKA